MSPETIELLTWISRGLLFGGALASTVFVVDYLRTANLRSNYSRMMITLNAAIAAVLWTSLANHFIPRSLGAYLFLFLMFGIVDAMLVAQIVLLHKARKRTAASPHELDQD